MKTGFYSPQLSAYPGVHIAYWNDICVEYGNGNPNDPANFSKDAFLLAATHFLNYCQSNKCKTFIQLPICQVWNVRDWEPASWLEDIIRGLREFPALEGWYLADEPEIWGYDAPDENGIPVSTFPELTHRFLHDRYMCIKEFSDKPVLAVFADIPLFERKYGSRVAFWDIFGFDYYPYVNKPQHARQWHRFATWKKLSRGMPVMYVGQGCGSSSPYGQVDMSQEDFDKQYQVAYDTFGTQMRYYLLWDWKHADIAHRLKAKLNLIKVRGWRYVKTPPPKVNKFVAFFRRLFGF